MENDEQISEFPIAVRITGTILVGDTVLPAIVILDVMVQLIIASF